MGIIRVFTGGFRTKGDVTTLESKKILTVALYAEQQNAYLNMLKVDIGDRKYTILNDAEYIDEEYFDAAYMQAQKAFNSWDEPAKSYIIGRFIWRGKEADDGMRAVADGLVNGAKSPWKMVAWK